MSDSNETRINDNKDHTLVLHNDIFRNMPMTNQLLFMSSTVFLAHVLILDNPLLSTSFYSPSLCIKGIRELKLQEPHNHIQDRLTMKYKINKIEYRTTKTLNLVSLRCIST